MYLDSKHTVANLRHKHKSIVINNVNVEIRPMVLPAQRIVLSNVSPIIPDSQIENIFKRNNIKLLSNITPLKGGITDPDLSYILSFRRQIYIDSEDAKRIPNSFTIAIENNTYRIFITIEKQTYFTYQQEGHIANQCQNTENPNKINSQTHAHKIPTSSTQPPTTDNISVTEIQTDANTNNETESPTKGTLELPETRKEETNHPKTNKTGIKRALSTASEGSNKNPVKPSNPEVDLKGPNPQTLKKYNKSHEPTFKKPKCPESPAFTLDRNNDMLETATKYINNKKKKKKKDNSQILGYLQLNSFIEKAIGAPNPKISKQYTTNTPALTELLIKIHPLLKELSIKIRIRKLYKKMTQDLSDPTTTNSSSEADSELWS